MAIARVPPTFGDLLRQWRERRRLTQLDLAFDAGVSARHLSFIETGRSQPSMEMVLRLAERLDIPIRERNQLLLAAGYAPAFPERPLADPELAGVREALDVIVSGQDPFPAVVVDRYWNLVYPNRTVVALMANVSPALLEPPINTLRVALHPDGLMKDLLNPGDVQNYYLTRLRRTAALTADPKIIELLEEVSSYPSHEPERDLTLPSAPEEILTPIIRMRISTGDEIRLFATVVTFGSAAEVTTSELSIELSFPADAGTAESLRRLPRR